MGMDTWGWSGQWSKAVQVKCLARSWPCECQDVLFVTFHGRAVLGASREVSFHHTGCGPTCTAWLSPLMCSKLATGSFWCPHLTRSGSGGSSGASSHWWPWASMSWLGKLWREAAWWKDWPWHVCLMWAQSGEPGPGAAPLLLFIPPRSLPRVGLL